VNEIASASPTLACLNSKHIEDAFRHAFARITESEGMKWKKTSVMMIFAAKPKAVVQYVPQQSTEKNPNKMTASS